MATSRSPLRFGIIGCGRVVRELHLPAWRLVPEAQVIAACDSSSTALEAMSECYPGIRKYTDVEPFLDAAGDLDFIVLATPGASHVSIGERVLRKRLHLLCEKPFAVDVKGAQRLFDIAGEEGMIVAPLHNYRYKDNVQAALLLRDRGVLGDVTSLSVRFRSGSLFDEPSKWMRHEREHQILLFDFAYHFVDIALMFLGPLSSLRFVDAELGSLGLEYVAFGTLHQYGGRGLFELTLDASCCSTEIDILGESRALAISFFPDGVRMLPRRDDPIHRGIAEANRFLTYAKHRVMERLRGKVSYRAVPHAHLFRAFVQAVRGEGSGLIGREEVVETISLLNEVAERAYSSEGSANP